MTDPNGAEPAGTDLTHAEPLWTVPNAISAVRILGLAPLLWTAHEGYREAFLWILLFLLISDWIDGKLAILLKQNTVFGARLDSAADALMYGALGVCVWWLEGEVVRDRIEWFAAAIGTWGVSVTVSLVRFGRMPSYHTWGAKASWLVAGTVTVVWLVFGNTFAVPWALAFVTITNLEAVAIGLTIPEWRVDVPSWRHALRIRNER